MLLCDVGNTNIHFYKDGISWGKKADIKNINLIDEKFYYICVNERLKDKMASMRNAVDLEPFFNLDTIYKGLGVDRVAACYAIDNGIVVDAGSAITVDIMANGIHLGGYIMPGLSAQQESFRRISSRLDIRINPNIDLEIIPQNSLEAVSYGVVKPIVKMLSETKKDKKIFFTGGDGKFFAKFFKDAIFDNSLVFRGMLKVLDELKKDKNA
ncbi:MAG: type III pantothenate kinase [Epsilonproteobacteria bacterium]|nr:type III pantothenate kinase [Campylobacterota bacterium]